MQQNSPATLNDVIAGIARAKASIIIGMVFGVALAALFIFASIPAYRAQMIVGPAAPIIYDERASAAADMHAPVLNDANAMNFTRFEATLAGPSVAGTLLKDEKIFEGLMQDKAFGVVPVRESWTPQELAEYVRKRVRIEPVGETRLRRLVYYHPSAGFAVYFLTRLSDTADGLIRRNIRAEAEKRVTYLQESSQGVLNPENRRSLTDLLMEQEKLMLLASVDQPYAATVVEPAASSSRPRWPSRLCVIAAFLLAGAIAGLVAHGFKSK
jgi:hypothetical protein